MAERRSRPLLLVGLLAGAALLFALSKSAPRTRLRAGLGGGLGAAPPGS